MDVKSFSTTLEVLARFSPVLLACRDTGGATYLRRRRGVFWLLVVSDAQEAREPQRDAFFWVHLTETQLHDDEDDDDDVDEVTAGQGCWLPRIELNSNNLKKLYNIFLHFSLIQLKAVGQKLINMTNATIKNMNSHVWLEMGPNVSANCNGLPVMSNYGTIVDNQSNFTRWHV